MRDSEDRLELSAWTTSVTSALLAPAHGRSWAVIIVMVSLFATLATAGADVARPDRVVLSEDYQVLQREGWTRARAWSSCPRRPSGITTLTSPSQDEREMCFGSVKRTPDRPRVARDEESRSMKLPGWGALHGPRHGRTADPAQAALALPQRPGRRHLDPGGQSTCSASTASGGPAGVALPEHAQRIARRRDAHWCAGVPPIHRIPESLADVRLKQQNPEYSDEKVRCDRREQGPGRAESTARTSSPASCTPRAACRSA